MDDQSRNLILATALSFLVILAWFVLGPILFPNAFPPPAEPTATHRPAGRRRADRRRPPPATAPRPAAAGAPQRSPRGGAGADRSACQIRTPRLEGSLSLTGGRIDDLKLTDYTESRSTPDSPIVTLLTPAGRAGAPITRSTAGRRPGR